MDLKVIKLVKHAHMLGGDVTTTMHMVEDVTAYQFLEESGALAQDCRVFVNSDPVGLEFLKTYTLKDQDAINLVVVQKDPVSGFLIANLGATVAGIVTNIAISFAVNFVVSTVFGRQERGVPDRKKDPEGYGLVGGNNAYRKFQPIPVVLGKTRIFPDYSSPWMVDYVSDPTACAFINNATVSNEDKVTPTFAFSPVPASKPWESMTVAEQSPGTDWTAASTNPAWGTTDGQYVFFYGAGNGGAGSSTEYNFAYLWTAPALGQPASSGTIQFQSYYDFWQTINAASGGGGGTGGD